MWHFLLSRSTLSSAGLGLKLLCTVSAYKDLNLDDSVHLNVTGQYLLYCSYRGALLEAVDHNKNM